MVSDDIQRNYEYEDVVHFIIRYTMDFKLKKVDRSIYSLLDWLGDIGGFVEALSWFSMFIIFLVQFQPLNSFLVRRLFYYDQSDDLNPLGIDVAEPDKRNVLKLDCLGHLKMLVYQ